MIKPMCVILVIICLVAASGCSGIVVSVPDPTPVPTPTPTPKPTTSAIIITTPTNNVTTATINATPAKTPTTAVNTTNITKPTTTRRTPKPTTAPVKTMDKLRPYNVFTDTAFTIEYPSNWTVESYVVPFEPSPISAGNSFNASSRQFYFMSKNESVYFVATVSDLVAPGTGVLNTDIYSCADSISERYDNVYGLGSLGSYAVRYTNVYKTPYVQFDVVIPDNSDWYPLAYTEMDKTTYHHYFNFRFFTPGDIRDYDDIREYMFYSIKTEEKDKPTGWIP